ncbi:hypothetical protein [Phenylobacterium sp.]|uniref:hypothetical protein n=1 Tax=Phenylobacterium sp. TaxID=1871053 RepID=UPI00301D3122
MGAERRPEDKIQSQGRKDNAAQHLNNAPDNPGAERYPSVNRDDSVDPGRVRRTSPGPDNPQPRQGAGDGR